LGVKGVLAWRVKAEKMNAFVSRALTHSIVSHLMQQYNDPAKVNQAIKNLGRNMGEFIYTRYLAATQAPAKKLEELANPRSAYNLGFKFFFGVTFDKTEFKKDGKDVYITYTIADCPACKDLISPSPQVFLCNNVAGIFEWIEENRLQDWHAESVTCDETLCRARGDPVCQWQYHFRLKEPELF
jgi:predicted hydrocarbon binding protein